MNVYARLSTESKDACAVASSLSADNVSLDNLSVKTGFEGSYVVSEVRAQSLSTVLSTLDDILRCQMASEALI